jgi:hypothetical protein
MGRQLDDPRFDPENDEWVGVPPGWDRQSSSGSGSSGRRGMDTFSTKQKAPSINASDFRVIFDRMDKGGLSMTYQRCLEELHNAGFVHLELDHVALVAELTQARGRTREWTGVPSTIEKLATRLGEQRKRRRSRRR